MSEINILETGLYKAVEKAGNVQTLATALKVSRQVVYIWLQQGHVPVARAVQIEKLTGVPRGHLIDPKLKSLLTE